MKKQKKSPAKESIRTGTSPETLAQGLLDNLYYIQGRPPELATQNDWYMALAYTVRDRLLQNWVQTLKTIRQDVKVVTTELTRNNLAPFGFFAFAPRVAYEPCSCAPSHYQRKI